jgi:hypothetical protein
LIDAVYDDEARVGSVRGRSPPRGFATDHPFIEDLKCTSFTTGEAFTERQACSAEFPDLFVRACRREAPLMRFLAQAMGLSC